MRRLKFISPSSFHETPIIPITFKWISFLSSNLNPPQTQQHLESPSSQEPVEPEPDVSNRSYWTRKIHRLCSVERNVDEALVLLAHLTFRGYRPDSLNLSSIIHALCDLNLFPEAHRRLSLFIASGFIPDERTCNVLIARLLNGRNPDETLEVFRGLIKAKPDYVPSLVNYNRLMDLICSFNRPSEAHQLLYDMKNRGHIPNVVSYTVLINGYYRAGQVSDAHKLFDEMSEGGVPPNALTYSILIRGILRQRDFERGKELIGRLWKVMVDAKDDSSGNNAAFANIIDSLCHEGLFHELFKIAEDMPQGKTVPEEFAFGQMIDSLTRAGRHNGAARIVYIMNKKGFTPSLVSYNSIVHGLCKENHHTRAYQLLEEGTRFGYSPSEFTYKVLVEGLCREFDLCKAWEVLQIMLKKEGTDKTRIYNIYLRGLLHMNNPTELLNVLVFMLQTNIKPDVITLNTVINGFCRMGKIDEALKIFEDMLNGKFHDQPNAVTFTSIITGLIDHERTEEALRLFNKTMSEKGIIPTLITYNSVLQCLFRKCQSDKAMDFFNHMTTNSKDIVVADCVTYTILIDGLSDSNQIDKAKKLWQDVIWPSKVHDNYVYSAVVKGLCRFGRLNEACDFLYELVDCGVFPGIVSYNIVIDCACKLGLKDEAYRILGELRRNGLSPDAVTWRILDKLRSKMMSRQSGLEDSVMTEESGSTVFSE